MFSASPNKQRMLGAFFLVVFIIVGVFGIFHFAMDMTGKGVLGAGCPFAANGSALCPMDAVARISAWQKSITVIPTLFVLALALLVVTGVRMVTPLQLVPLTAWRTRDRARRAPPLLQELFSRGLLNPKTF